jgi:dipeptidyl aminopeptidase/acylaminoacyl peptidase
MKKYLVCGLFVIIILIGGGLIWRRAHPSTSTPLSSATTVPPPEPVIPTALAPLTIPYLRERDYTSTLEFGELLEETSTYQAYFATYPSDDLPLHGLLTIPTGPPPPSGWPAVILVHGYLNPATYQTNGTSYRGWWQTLASTGDFVVFKIDLRGHGQSAGTPSGAYYSSDYVIDVLNARAALMASDFVNPQAIGLWGHSMSGNVVLRALAARPALPAVSLWAGAGYTYQDLAQYRIHDPSYVPRSPAPTPVPIAIDTGTSSTALSTGTIAGNPAANNTSTTSNPVGANPSANPVRPQGCGNASDPPEYHSPFWRAMIPTNFLSDLTGAIQLQHASDDDVVSINYSRDLDTLLTAADLNHQFFEYSSGGHNLSGATFTSATTRLTEFFTAHLNPNQL